MSETDDFLIWSIEHRLWWARDREGYVRELSKAGRYSRSEAQDICASAIPGTAHKMRQFPEIPVPLADMFAIILEHGVRYPNTGEPWE